LTASGLSSARRGSVIGATWLIGLGVVFLVRQAVDLSWSQAWPLFVILVGVASFVSTVLSWRPSVSGIWSLTWPAAWIVGGAILLASTTGSISQSPGELISEFGPWALVGLGVWFVIGAVIPGGPEGQEALVIPLGGATEAAVRIRFGVGEMTVGAAALGNLLNGRFAGGVKSRIVGPGRVELQQETDFGVMWLDRRSTWDIGLTAEVPLDLRLDGGASRARIDARDLKLRSLEVHTGASDTHVLLPRAAGMTTVRAEAGAASLTFEVPLGVAARIRTKMALGSSQVDQAHFPAVGGGFESPDYATAANRVEIDVSGGVGSVKVVGGGA
jgi:hypothetical protein